MARGRGARESSKEHRGSSSKRQRRSSSSTTPSQVSLVTIVLIVACVFVVIGRNQSSTVGAFARAALEKFSAAPSTFESRVGLEDSENEEISVVEEEEETVSEPKRKQPVKAPSRILDRRGVKEYLTTRIREHFEKDINNVKNTCMLVTIRNGNVTFAEEYPELQHGRAPSVKYILGKIVREKGMSLAGATFLVMLSDGHRPHVVTFGSARHWKAWKHMVPVPLGNERGWKEGWGTPLDGWDAYVDRNLLSSHGNYSWEEKIEKAVFRGSLTMHSYKLGSCNEENKGACERATKWNEVNRGVVYEKTMEHPELFDVAFVALKRKMQAPKDQFLGAPKTVPPMRFQDYQQYKYLLNVGNNQDWAERLRSLLFMKSAVINHKAESQEFFTPLLKPWVHFIPTSLHFEDVVKNVQWAKENDLFVQQIVRNQNAFADRYISERAMQQYWEVLIEEFSSRQALAAAEAHGYARPASM